MPDDWDGLFLFAGPSYIIHAYRNREADANDRFPCGELLGYLGDDAPSSGFLTCGLEQICKTRTGNEFDLNCKQRVLDVVGGAEDLCKQLAFGLTLREGIFSRDSYLHRYSMPI